MSQSLAITVKIHQTRAHALVSSRFQIDIESFDLKFSFFFQVSNESTNFLMNLQNSNLGISASLKMSRKRKGHCLDLQTAKKR